LIDALIEHLVAKAGQILILLTHLSGSSGDNNCNNVAQKFV